MSNKANVPQTPTDKGFGLYYLYSLTWFNLSTLTYLDVLNTLMKREKIRRFQGNYDVSNKNLNTKPVIYTSPFTRCDYVHNFFMAKTEAFHSRNIQWNETLKLNEHEAFFFEAKQKGLRVVTTEEVSVIHQHILTKNYFKYRHSIRNYRKIFLQQQGLKRFIDEELGIDVIL